MCLYPAGILTADHMAIRSVLANSCCCSTIRILAALHNHEPGLIGMRAVNTWKIALWFMKSLLRSSSRQLQGYIRLVHGFSDLDNSGGLNITALSNKPGLCVQDAQLNQKAAMVYYNKLKVWILSSTVFCS